MYFDLLVFHECFNSVQASLDPFLEGSASQDVASTGETSSMRGKRRLAVSATSGTTDDDGGSQQKRRSVDALPKSSARSRMVDEVDGEAPMPDQSPMTRVSVL